MRRISIQQDIWPGGRRRLLTVLYCAAIWQGNPGSDGPPGRDGATGVKVKNTNIYPVPLLIVENLKSITKTFYSHIWLLLQPCPLCLRVIAVTPDPLVLPVPQVLPVLTAQLDPPANRETEEKLWVNTANISPQLWLLSVYLKPCRAARKLHSTYQLCFLCSGCTRTCWTLGSRWSQRDACKFGLTISAKLMKSWLLFLSFKRAKPITLQTE